MRPRESSLTEKRFGLNLTLNLPSPPWMLNASTALPINCAKNTRTDYKKHQGTEREAMADQATTTAPGPDPKASSDYIQFKALPPGGPLNRWSANITRGHDFPGAQVSLSSRKTSPVNASAWTRKRCQACSSSTPPCEEPTGGPEVGPGRMLTAC